MFIQRLVEELRAMGAEVSVDHNPRAKTRTDLVVDVSLDDARARFVVEYKPRAPFPNEAGRFEALRRRLEASGTPMLLAPYVSHGQGDALVRTGWSWADTQGNFDLRSGPIRLRQRTPESRRSRAAGVLPRGPGGLAVVRALIYGPSGFNDPRLGQHRLAASAGVSQPRVAQVLGRLRDAGLVRGRGREWRADREALLDAFLEEYRGPGGQEEYFYTLDPLVDVAWAVASRGPGEHGVVSADVGPDLLTPVRGPTHLIAYLSGPPDLSKADLVPAQGRGDANVILRWPTDRSVLGPEGWILVRPARGRRIRVAHPTQLMWDLRWLGGEDRMEAARELRKWILASP
jgi:hypothetical protein